MPKKKSAASADPSPSGDEMVPVTVLSEKLGVSAASIGTWARDKLIPSVKRGRARLYDLERVRSAMAKQGLGARKLGKAEPPRSGNGAPAPEPERARVIDIQSIRRRLAGEAREAFRKILFEEARKAELRADNELHLVLLKEYVRTEPIFEKLGGAA